MKPTHVLIGLLLLSFSMNVYFFLPQNKSKIGNSVFTILDKNRSGKTGIIYQQDCPNDVVESKICSIEVLEKRTDFAMVRVHYHYFKKANEDTNRIVVKSNKGSHDNVIGTRSAFHLKEGDNTIDLPFGMYRTGTYTRGNPYSSKYIMVQARGISKDSKYYITPPIFDVFANYDQEWYVDGEKSSWR